MTISCSWLQLDPGSATRQPRAPRWPFLPATGQDPPPQGWRVHVHLLGVEAVKSQSILWLLAWFCHDVDFEILGDTNGGRRCLCLSKGHTLFRWGENPALLGTIPRVMGNSSAFSAARSRACVLQGVTGEAFLQAGAPSAGSKGPSACTGRCPERGADTVGTDAATHTLLLSFSWW